MSHSTGGSGPDPDWLVAEREYEDDLRERGTIPELFEESARRNLDREAQLFKAGIYQRSLDSVLPETRDGEYGSITYGEMRDIVRTLAAGFRDVGVEARDRVAMYADTRMEWAQADLALLAAGAVVTTVYPDSSTNQLEYLLSDPDATAVVVENESLLERIFEVEDALNLETIVLMDTPSEPIDRDDVYTLGNLYERGRETFDREAYDAWLAETHPDDLASLIYTSGTTGKPKGVQLTHWNFRTNIHQIRRRAGPRPAEPDRLSIEPGMVSISFLPLAHVFERLAGHFLMYGTGVTVGYTESTDSIADDIKQIQPHTGASVPRVYERIFDNMRTQASESPIKERIFNWSLGVAERYARTENPGPGLRLKHSLADKLVFSTVKEQLGGRIEFMVSGGGSLSIDLARLFKGMGIPILEGYGLTETAPVVSVNRPDDVRPGTLGPPLYGVEVAFDESKAVGDRFEGVEGTVGELLVRGENIANGYWNRPGATERSFTSDPFGEGEDTGTLDPTDDDVWFRTGDIVQQTPDGYLVFHERIKQIFVLSTGKNVAPGPIEDMFATNDRVEQAMVVGDNWKFVGALIVPNFERLRDWAADNDISLPETREELCEDERVKEWIQHAVDSINEDLERVEKVKQFSLVPHEWTVENQMLTPSMKKKRRNILDAHEKAVEQIYES